MDRHRHQQVGLGQQIGPGARHPRRQPHREVGTIGVLEGQNQPRRRSAVDQGEPPPPDRPGGGADARRPGLGQGPSAPLAARR
jgi:hypothetical protein